MTTTNTPLAILASEPIRKRGVKTPFRQTGDREVTFTWEVGHAANRYGEMVDILAVLNCTYEKGRGFRASLWRHETDTPGITTIVFDGVNGVAICGEPAPRYAASKLEPFADMALITLRAVAHDVARVAAYFDPAPLPRPDRAA